MADIFELFRKIGAESTPRVPISHIIVGLGNPGREYELTRHNAGFRAIDYIAGRCSVKICDSRFSSLCGEGEIGGVRVLFMKPVTYMNSSGTAVAAAATFYKIPPENILVLHDEISFPVGRMRIRRKGSAGGHNGLKSIIASIGSEDFPRIKIGVGQKPSPDYDLADWVLSRMTEGELTLTREQLPDIYESVRLIVCGSIDEAMMKYSK